VFNALVGNTDDHEQNWVQAKADGAAQRSRATSRPGGAPKMRLYSRLNFSRIKNEMSPIDLFDARFAAISRPGGDPSHEGECAIEHLDIHESGLAKQVYILARREDG
jgi:hypothetical protein